MPEDFIAVNSVCSPRLPKHIRVANRVANGNAVGTVIKEKNMKSLAKTGNPRSFPINSLKYIIKNLIKNIKTTMTVVNMKGPRYALINNLSIFFIGADCNAKFEIFYSKSKQLSFIKI
jgi:hypothetical protein